MHGGCNNGARSAAKVLRGPRVEARRAAPVTAAQHGGHAAAARPQQHARVGGTHHRACEVCGERQRRRGVVAMRPRRATMLPFYLNCILAAHAYGLEILDGPYSDFSNAAGFAAECAQSRDMGFDGKTLIHPSQIEACNAAFTPPAEEVAAARRIIAAFELPENASRGAIQIDGRMVERLHADMARRTIAIADAIAAAGK